MRRLLVAALACMNLAAASPLDTELQEIVTGGPLASLSVLAIRDGRVVYQRQFGQRFIDNADPAKSLPANEATMYRIASISKLVTAIGVMRLVEQGKLDLDADIGTYLGYRVRNPNFPEAPITLRALLSHTSSLRDDAGYVFSQGDEMREFLVPGGKSFGTGAMWSREGPPGRVFAYCNLNSGVVGTVMEQATGERFDRLMKRLVLDPLGMKGGFNPAEMPPERVRDIAVLYRKAPSDEGPWDPKGPWHPQVDDYSKTPPANRAGPDYRVGSNGALFGPQGGLRASVLDLSRVMRMLMAKGTIDGKRFLQARTVDAMLARQWKYDGESNGTASFGSQKDLFHAWGLGNQQFLDVSGPGSGDRLVEGGGFRAIGHLGDAYGLHGGFLMDPDKRNGIIYLAGGTGWNPDNDRAADSGLRRYEERIVTILYRRAILGTN